MSLGDDQGSDAGGGQMGEKVVCIVGRSRYGDGRAQVAVIIDDDGEQALGTLPQGADAHGRNSSRAV